MKIIYPVCCGVDVHKETIVATIATTDKSGITRYLTETFSTINHDLFRFRDWLKNHGCLDVCMESTGKYWIPVFNILEKAGIRVLLTHPMYVRAIKGKKTDKKDSKWGSTPKSVVDSRTEKSKKKIKKENTRKIQYTVISHNNRKGKFEWNFRIYQTS